MQIEVLTDIGRKRTVNEDSAAVYTRPNGPILAVIADGMGGHRGGDYASSTAVRMLGEEFTNVKGETVQTKEDWEEWLYESVIHVNLTLFETAQNDEEFKGMGTTIDAALMLGNELIVLHIGDSRVYTVDKEQIIQITKDHSFVNALLDSGEITEEEAASHPQRNWIMRALGSEKTIRPDLHKFELKKGMYLLICTDGLTNKLDNEMIKEVILAEDGLKSKAAKLIHMANELGGEDNISVILAGPADTEVSEF
ncbi:MULTISPECIES: Stp1/IreP family PP2C-type Ser/Thr phosphatase [Sporosarcina]|uniref:Stp1/IreP family PP2C-type Ser/Thr phosphatase n=1 Tax=Sporosarcina contaminans TaxID=633403 RepID=A0ABW3TTL3_9BACL